MIRFYIPRQEMINSDGQRAEEMDGCEFSLRLQYSPLSQFLVHPMVGGRDTSFPSPADLPDPGIEPWSPALQADALTSEPPGKQ